ncbi:MAG TPA: DUF1343 domain-containing protein [Candidatus Binatia bacterium]|nr:DUF1343 domain-containing protein [Candidatus Binatia bacterium]
MNLRHHLSRANFLSGTLATACLAARPASAAPVVELGSDALVNEEWRDLAGRRVGIVTNQTGLTSRGESVVDALRRNRKIRIVALYAPEHGLRGDRAAGAYVPSYVDPQSGLPVYSLYGATRHPTAAMLANVDVMLFDIQDVGDGAYTFVSTMAYVMQAGQQYGKQVWILDRPNPIGGELVEGPVTDPKFASFIRLYPTAFRHGMTIGELAQLFNSQFGIGCQLRVIPMRGWRRSMVWPDTGLTWIPTSPNIPTWQTALVYPATGLVGGFGINQGLGYKPFALAGAYGLNGGRFAAYLNERNIPGVKFLPIDWSPPSGFWAGKMLSGAQLDVYDGHIFPSVRTAVELLGALRAVAPKILSAGSTYAIDRDWGTDQVRTAIMAGANVDAVIAAWQPNLKTFLTQRAQSLLYA